GRERQLAGLHRSPEPSRFIGSDTGIPEEGGAARRVGALERLLHGPERLCRCLNLVDRAVEHALESVGLVDDVPDAVRKLLGRDAVEDYSSSGQHTLEAVNSRLSLDESRKQISRITRNRHLICSTRSCHLFDKARSEEHTSELQSRE